MTKKTTIATMLAMFPLLLTAQTSGSNSSYSRYGLGTMDEQSQTFNRGMGGVAMGLRSGNRINMQNPASYSAIDSLSFIFDIGLTLQAGHLSSQGNSTNVKNTALTNINAAFRARPGLGMSIGFVPYSSIGYTFQNEGRVGSGMNNAKPITTQTTYAGTGGIHQIYLGAGWNPVGKLSLGANVSYLWGEYAHSMSHIFYEGNTTSTNYTTQNNRYSADISTYKLDLGAQYSIRLTGEDWLTVGATYSLGHPVNNDAVMNRYNSTNDTITRIAPDAFSLPHAYGAGLAWTHKAQWLVAADVLYEQWDGCKVPMPLPEGSDISYQVRTDQYANRLRLKAGAEYTPDNTNRNRYLQTVKYRLGVNYATPHIKVNGQDGPMELRLCAGLGLPLQTRKMSGRSYVNASAEWLLRKPSAPQLITENYFMLNLGLTFNERWFQKWKIN